MNISVRAAQIADAASIAQLTGQLGYALAPEDAAARLSKILSRRDHQFLVADAEGAILGWMHASLSEHIDAETSVLIEGLVVDRNHRGEGIGKLLLARAEEWGKASGYTIVKTQFSFAKGLDAAGREAVKHLAPRVEP